MVQLINVLSMLPASWVILFCLAGCLKKEAWRPIVETDELLVPVLGYVRRPCAIHMPRKSLDVEYKSPMGKLMGYAFLKDKLYLVSQKKIVRFSINEHGNINTLFKENRQGFTKIKALKDSLILFGDTDALVVDPGLDLVNGKKISLSDKIVHVFYSQGRIFPVTASGSMVSYTEDLGTKLWESLSYNEYSVKKPFVYPIRNQIFCLSSPDKLLSIDIDSGTLTKVENIWAENGIDIAVGAGLENLYISNGKYLFIKTGKQVIHYMVPHISKIYTKGELVILETQDELLVSNAKEIVAGKFFGRIPKVERHSIVMTKDHVYLMDSGGVSIFNHGGKLLSRIKLKNSVLLDLEGSVGIMSSNRFCVYT